MDKKVLFNEALASLVEFAGANGNVVTTKDIKTYFESIIDDESQYQLIYEYLLSSKITISDFNNNQSKSISALDSTDISDNESEEELSFIEMYLSELNAIVPITDDELMILLDNHVSGDNTVDNRIIESQLSKVANIADNYRGKGVSIGDLIQEGNVALMMALSQYKDSSIDFYNYIENSITQALDSVINDEISLDRIGDRLANKLNQLDSVTRDLSEKLGRVPNVEEISAEMNITKEEAEMLLKTSLDTLSINEDKGLEDDELDSLTDSDDIFAPKDDPLNWKYSKK